MAGSASAQAVDDRLVPRGSVRASVWPSFHAWDEAFGAGGGRVPLGRDVSAGSAFEIFPGASMLSTGLRSLSGDDDYAPNMGAVEGRVSHDVTRIDLGLHLGVTDWWTIGVTMPRIKNRAVIDMVFVPDTIGGDMGISPYVTAPNEVGAFLSELQTAASAAVARADALCGANDPQCAAATELAQRASTFDASMRGVYTATPFFPLEGSMIAGSLALAVENLDMALTSAGLAGIQTPLLLAGSRATEADLETLPTRFDRLGYAAPLQTRTGLWAWGDVEISTYARVLRLQESNRSIEVIAGGLLRLGTGTAASPDVPLDRGAGDGQTDVEGRLAAHGVSGPVSLRLGGIYGIQGSRALTRRFGDPGAVLAPIETRLTVDWEPGSYKVVEAEPGIRLARALTLSGTYRYLGRDGDTFRIAGGGAEDPVQLQGGASVSRHEVGGALTYDTAEPAAEAGFRPVRFRVRLITAVAGRGPDMPAGTRVDLGAELFTSLWGGG